MSMFRRPEMPKVAVPDAPPPPPERSDPETAALAEAQRARFGRGGGRASTMLTGGNGTGGGQSAVRFLGGAART